MMTHTDDLALERQQILDSVTDQQDDVFRDCFVENLALEVWPWGQVGGFMNCDQGDNPMTAWSDIWPLLNASTGDMRAAYSKTVDQRSGVES